MKLLAVGEQAPEFSAEAQSGERVSSADLRGKIVAIDVTYSSSTSQVTILVSGGTNYRGNFGVANLAHPVVYGGVSTDLLRVAANVPLKSRFVRCLTTMACGRPPCRYPPGRFPVGSR